MSLIGSMVVVVLSRTTRASAKSRLTGQTAKLQQQEFPI